MSTHQLLVVVFDFELRKPSNTDGLPQLTSVVKAAAKGSLETVKQILEADRRKVKANKQLIK
jgi:hypothetical protein